MTDATELDLDAIRARVDAATEGPWEATPNGRILSLTWPCDDVAGWFGNKGAVVETLRNPDAEFIAHARTDVPLLLAALDEARENEAIMKAFRRRAFTAEVGHMEALTRAAAAEAALEEARTERDSVQFALDGFRGVARKDNEHLIARATAVEAEVERLRAVVERVEALRDEAERRGEESIARDFNGNPFPSVILPADLRAALDPAVPATEGGEER